MSIVSFGVADLTIKGDALAELALDPRAMQFLEHLIACGGEGSWTWNGLPPAMSSMVCDLIEANIVVEREYITHALQTRPDRLTIRITNKGRNVVEAQKKRKIVAGNVTVIAP